MNFKRLRKIIRNRRKNNMIQTVKYAGKKNGRYMERLFSLLPQGKPKRVIETNMGSGTFIASAKCLGDVQRVAYEKNFSTYAMNHTIQKYPYELIESFKDFEYSKSEYDRAESVLNTLKKCPVENMTKEDYVNMANAKIVMAYCSRNGWNRGFRELDFVDKCEKGSGEFYMKKQQAEFFRNELKNNIARIISACSNAFREVDIVYGDMFEHGEIWGERGNLIFVDPPYLPEKVGDTKNKLYECTWEASDHEGLIRLAMGAKAKVIICSNMLLENNEVFIPEGDPYNMLLHNGYDMVDIMHKSSAEIQERDESHHKKRKTEVVYVNYRINNPFYKIYSYKDIGKVKAESESA